MGVLTLIKDGGVIHVRRTGLPPS